MANIMSYFKICLALLTLIFIVFITFGFHKRSPSNRFNKVIVFGDSFSDTGNVYRLTNHAVVSRPQFYQGRYCDGPIWVDRLEVHEKYSYAYGGAVTDNDFLQGSTKSQSSRVPGVRQQITTYLEEARKNSADIALPLYIIWIGYNNFAIDPSVDPKLVVNSLMNAIQVLLDAGAKHFLIFNEAPFQAFPVYRKWNRTEFHTQLTNSFNKELEDSLVALQKNQSQTSIHMFDNHALITKIISGTSSKAFTNAINACCNHYTTDPGAKPCSDPKQYVFFDRVHFSSSVHRLIADAIQPFLSFRFSQNTPDSYIHSF